MKNKNSIIESAMRNRGITFFLIALLVLVGVYALLKMPKQEFPAFTIRQGVIVGVYPGATSAQVEEQLAKPLEEFLFTYKEIRKNKTYTMSRDGVVYAMVELEENVDNKDEVWSKIKHGLSLFKAQLPSGVLALIANDDFGDTSALLISLESETRSYRELEDWLEVLEGKLRRIESVSNLRRFGLQKEQIGVYLNAEQLSAYGIDRKMLGANLFSQGFTTVSGTIETEKQDYPLYFAPTLDSETEVGEQIVYSDPTGKIIRLKDIATIVREYDTPDSYILNNGKKSIILSMEMHEGYNIVEYGKDVDKVLKSFSATLPDDVQIERIVDQPKVVNQSVLSFLRDLVSAIIIVIVVLIILFPLRSALVSASMIPITIFISVGIMFLCDIPLNTVTLAALIVILGMVGDNSIVVIDAYLEYLNKGMLRWHAAYLSAKNYAGAIFIATLSICIVFFPLLIILNGIWYDFVRHFPWTFSICLMVSFALTMLCIPFMEYTFITKENIAPKRPDRKGLTYYVQHGYERILDKIFRFPKTTMGVAVVLLAVSVVYFFRLPVRMFPFSDRDQFAVEIYLPQGSSLEETEQVADSLYRIMRQDERITSVTAFVGTFSPRFQAPYAPNIVAGKNYTQFIVNTLSNDATVEVLDEYAAKYSYHFPNAYVRFKQLDCQQAQIPIEIRLSGTDVEELKTYADTVLTALKDVEGLVWRHTNYEEPLAAVEMELDAIAASRLGISRSLAELEIASAYGDVPVGTVWEEDYPLSVVLKRERPTAYDAPENVGDQYIHSLLPNVSVPLRQIADVKPVWTQGQIVRRNGVRTISIFADVVRGMSESRVFAATRKAMEERVVPKLPATIDYEYGGMQEVDNEVIPLIIQIILAGIFLIFLFLIYNYRKISVSLAALLSMLFCIPGTVWGLYLTDTAFSLTCILGIISLMGVIIRNAIMIFDHAENLRLNARLSARQAAYEAGKRRMVPIFLTSATTAIGIVPMILGRTLLWTPMGIVIFTGTILSMILVVTVLPVMYWKIFEKTK